MRKVILPPEYVEISVNEPVLFLAGPIQGAPDWQNEAISIIHNLASNLDIASPRRDEFKNADYNEQVDWEHFYLDRAARNGVIMFWLAREANHVCERAYAQTSRFELGEAITLHRWQKIKVIVGIEDGFSNSRYLKKTISKKASGILICSNLRETCEKAVKLIYT